VRACVCLQRQPHTQRRTALTQNVRPTCVAGGSAPGSPHLGADADSAELPVYTFDLARTSALRRIVYYYDASPSASVQDEGARRSYEEEDAARARAGEEQAYETIQREDMVYIPLYDFPRLDYASLVPACVQREAAERSWAAEDAHAAPSLPAIDWLSDGGGDGTVLDTAGASAHGSPVQVAGGSGRPRSTPEAVPDEQRDTPLAKRAGAGGARGARQSSGRALFADSGSSDIESPPLTALPALALRDLPARAALEFLRARRDAGGARNGGATTMDVMEIAAQQHQQQQQHELPQAQTQMESEALALGPAAVVAPTPSAALAAAPAPTPTVAPTAAPAPAPARAASPAVSDNTRCGCGDGEICDFHMRQRLHAPDVVEETPPDLLAAAAERRRLDEQGGNSGTVRALTTGRGTLGGVAGGRGTMGFFYPPRAIDERVDDDASLVLLLDGRRRTPVVDAAVNAMLDAEEEALAADTTVVPRLVGVLPRGGDEGCATSRGTGYECIYELGGNRTGTRFRADIKQSPYPLWQIYAATLGEALALRNAELARRGRQPTRRSKPGALCIIGCGKRAHFGHGHSKVLSCPLVIGLADPQSAAYFCTFVRDLRYE
jgi:hypothetical protein